MITIESKDIILERISEDSFKISIGDIEMTTNEIVECRIGDTITIPIPSILVLRSANKALLVELDQ